jgi:antitoxin component YwqK of YwqJK toxin-antitoxin module
MNKHSAKLLAVGMAAIFLSGCAGTMQPIEQTANFHGTGEVVEYHANGKVRRKATYVDGRLVTTESYYASGTKESDESYDYGELHSATYFFSSGEVRATITGTNTLNDES